MKNTVKDFIGAFEKTKGYKFGARFANLKDIATELNMLPKFLYSRMLKRKHTNNPIVWGGYAYYICKNHNIGRYKIKVV
ncbi:hypothetical protein FJZ33_00060 [Candidatus Poribacteria bacterium]|nr:hypothetical protein [Candidatus Poribacteria bacterium]